MHRKRVCLLVIGVLSVGLLGGGVSAPEAAIYVSGPVEGNSWSFGLVQGLNELWLGNIVGPYDYIRADWVSGATFEAPLFRSQTAGWASGAFGQTSTFSWMTGPSADFSVQLVFNDPLQLTTFDYFVYDGSSLKQAQRITLGPNYFSSFDLSMDQAPGRFEPVPEPASLVLMGLGLLGSARAIRRRRSS